MPNEHAHPHGDVQITVNDQFVIIRSGKHTPLQIKQAAISVGVPIQLDFVLSEVHPSGQQKVLLNDDEIPVKDGDEFWAIPGDDNS